jgi:hypothetical protein
MAGTIVTGKQLVKGGRGIAEKSGVQVGAESRLIETLAEYCVAVLTKCMEGVDV